MKFLRQSLFTRFSMILRTRKDWLAAFLLGLLNFLVMFFGPFFNVYITLFRGSPILLPAGLLYAGFIFASFIAGKLLFKSSSVGLISMLIFSLLAPALLDMFINNILFLFEAIVFTLSLGSLTKIFQREGKEGWRWISLLTFFILFFHAATGLLYLITLFISLLYLRFFSHQKLVFKKALLYVGPIIIVWLIALFMSPLGASSLDLVKFNIFTELKLVVALGTPRPWLTLLFIGGGFSFPFHLSYPPKKKAQKGIIVCFLWLFATLIVGGLTFIFPVRGIVTKFSFHLLLLFTFLFSSIIDTSLSQLKGKGKEIDEKETTEEQDKKLQSYQVTGKVVPLLILVLFCSFVIISPEVRDLPQKPRFIRGEEFYDTQFSEGNKPEEEDPKEGFGEDFSNISDWEIAGNHKKQPNSDGDKIQISVQSQGNTQWAVLNYYFHGEGLNVSIHHFLAIRITNFNKTGPWRTGRFNFEMQGEENKAGAMLVRKKEDVPDTFYVNLYELAKSQNITSPLQNIKLVLASEGKNTVKVKLDWMKIYSIKEYTYQGENLIGKWSNWRDSYILSSTKGVLRLNIRFRSNTREYLGIKKELQKVSTDNWIGIRYRTSDSKTGVTLDLTSSSVSKRVILPASTRWNFYTIKLSKIISKGDLEEFCIYLMDSWKSIPSLSGEQRLYIDEISIGSRGKLVPLF